MTSKETEIEIFFWKKLSTKTPTPSLSKTCEQLFRGKIFAHRTQDLQWVHSVLWRKISFFLFPHNTHGRKKYYLRIMFGHSYWRNIHSEKCLNLLISLICLLTFLPLMSHANDWPNLNGHGKKRIKQRRIPGQGHIWLSIADAESLNAFQGKNLILGLWVLPIKEVI